MKSIMLSTNPEWVAKIMNGEKEDEIRKTKPNCELPIDVLMYVTKEKPYITQQSNYQFTIRDTKEYTNLVNGKVVAKFTLEKISPVVMQKGVDDGYGNNGFLGYALCGNCFDWKVEEKACLTEDELFKYLNGIKRPLIIPKDYKCRRGYAWHISNLVIFDKPKELSEFGLKRAPESWQYVEVE